MGLDLKEFREKWRKDRCIICPYCKYEHDVSQHWEVMGRLVTYHGNEDGPVEFTCQSCDKNFFVKEWVERTFEEKKTVEEFD